MVVDDHRLKLYEEISRQVAEIKDSNANVKEQAAVVRDLALAFRYAAGGTQPGAVVVEK